MDIMLAIWCACLFFISGFVIGKIEWRPKLQPEYAGGQPSDAGEKMQDVEPEKQGGRFLKSRNKVQPGAKRIPLGWAIGSPVAGEVKYYHEGTKRGAMIVPKQEILYAPASGKIIRLYPTGNAMRLRTDCGIELLIQAGVDTDELEGRYYRPRVLQNEVVNKGKPLLQFDIIGLRTEGYDPAVMVSVEEADDYRNITVCDSLVVKAGEDLMWVSR